MKITDIIWGDVKESSKEFSAIVKSKPFQRLKNIHISTYGYLFELKRNSTRYDHSIGVYLLLKKYGASREEQIAGLVHDIAHFAFSHLATYALQGKYTEVEIHDLVAEKFLEESGLKKLIEDLGFNYAKIIDKDSLTLLENKLPDICADRIDYAIRDALHLQIISRTQADLILEGLTIHQGEFVFNNIKSAFEYSFAFYLLNLQHYGSATEAHFNNDFGTLINLAIKKGILQDSDWLRDDLYIIKLLKKSKDKEIKNWLKSYNRSLMVFEDSKNPTIVFPKKIRIVDPKVLIDEKLQRLSEVDEVYKRIIDDYSKSHTKHELSVKILRKNYK